MQFEELRVVAFGSITNGFTEFGAPYANPVRILKVVNGTDATIELSFDGVNPHDVYLPDSAGVYDFTTNRQASSDQAEQPKNTQVYLRYSGLAPSLGDMYLVVVFANSQ